MFKIALRSLRQHALASVLTAISVALGTALALTVLLLGHGAQNAFARTATGVPVLVAGTKGSSVDALLATLFHTGRTPGRVAMSYVEELRDDPRVAWAIPVALGDRVHGFPLVGTTPEIFSRFEPRPGAPFVIAGKSFEGGRRLAVAGAHTGLAVGDEFSPSHSGVEGDPTHSHEPFTVSGVLAPTGTAHDRAVWIALEDFLGLAGHGQGVKAVSAVYLKPKNNSPLVVEPLLRDISEGTAAQAIRPTQVVAELVALFGTAQRVLQLVSWLVIVVAGVSVSVSLYSAMAARRKEIAILRALGASRSVVVQSIVLEAVLICTAGAIVGLVLGHLGVQLAAPMIERYAGAAFETEVLLPTEPLLLLGMAGVGALAGALPAARAYRTDVASAL